MKSLESIPRPLKKRKEFWAKHTRQLKEGTVVIPTSNEEQGTVVIPTGDEERRDIKYSADAVLINEIQNRLMANFERPVLGREYEFYSTFIHDYFFSILEQEQRVWDQLGQEVVDGKYLKDDPVRAAYLTTHAAAHGEHPPSSSELYAILPLYARVYEHLLKTKYADAYTPDVLYETLEKHMPKFISKVIAEDSVVTGVINHILSGSDDEMGKYISPTTIFMHQFMELDEEDGLRYTDQLQAEVAHKVEQLENPTDFSDRNINRGCPFLYAGVTKQVLSFAVGELIEQHKLFFVDDSPAR